MMFHHNQGIILLASVSQDMNIKFTLKKGYVDPNIKKRSYFGNVASKFSSAVKCSCDFGSVYIYIFAYYKYVYMIKGTICL